MKPPVKMPPKRKKPSVIKKKTPLKRKQYTEDQMKEAISAVRTGISPFVAAKKFDVPRATLISKLEGKYESDKCGPDGYLNVDEEKMLVNWVRSMGNAGFPISKTQLLDSVQKLVGELKKKKPDRNFPFKDNRPGRHWFESFLRRHSDISMRVSQNLTSSRASVSEEKIKEWHGSIYTYLKENHLDNILKDPRRVFNADEAAFFLNPKGNKVLHTRGEKCIYSIVNVDEKECLTVMLTCNAAGAIAPPMIVFQYERIPQDIVESINPLWGIGKSENGWMTGAVFYEFITNIFHPWLVQEKIPLPVILFVDGHVSHLSLHTSLFCEKNGIVLVALYPNSTHIIQPLDVAVFRTLKAAWKEEVHNWRFKEENIGKELKKKHFSPILEKAISRVVTEPIVNNAFRKCGLYPWDVSAINFKLIKCNNKKRDTSDEPVTPLPAPSRDSNSKISIALEVIENEIDPLKRSLFVTNLKNDNWAESIEVKDYSLFQIWKKLKTEVDMEVEFEGFIPLINEYDLSELSESMLGEIQVLAMEPYTTVEPSDTSTTTVDENVSGVSVVGLHKPESDVDLPESSMYIGQSEASCSSKTATVLSTNNNTSSEKDGMILKVHEGENQQNCQLISSSSQIEKDLLKESKTAQDPKAKLKIDRGEISHSPLLPSPFKNLLVYPEPKDSKKKKRAKEVIPFVISGKHYQEYYKKKVEKKNEQARLKEERIKKRKEKAEEKAKAQEVKKQSKRKIKAVETSEESSADEPEECRPSDCSSPNLKICENSYVIVHYEGEYFPGLVLEKIDEGAKVKVMGMAGVDTWKWPEKDDILFYEKEDIKAVIDLPELKNSRGHYFVPEILTFRNR